MTKPTKKSLGERIMNRANMVIVFRTIDKLLPYAKNARTHSPQQVAEIAASMHVWGWTNPVLIDERDMIIAGHGRVLAARKLGLTEDIPCIVLEGLTDTQKQALIIADNKIAMNAGWNNDTLIQELGEIHLSGEIDVTITGFSSGEIDSLLHGIGPLGDGHDEGPEAPPAIPVSAKGDLWILGRHRLLLGDSTIATDVDRLMAGKQADFCFTSPPYGNGDWDTLMNGVFDIIPLRPKAQLLVNLGLVHQDVEWVPYWTDWIEHMRAQGWRRFGWYVWDQCHGLQGDFRGRLAPSFEFIFHFNREIVKPHRTVPRKAENIRDMSDKKKLNKDANSTNRTFDTLRYPPKSSLNTHKIPDSVIRVQRHTGGFGSSGKHSAPYPVDLVSEMLTAFSNPEQVAYEPFCGSGASIISCQKNGRSCMAMEIAPECADVAVKRFQKFSGQSARLDGDGRSFDEISEARER